MTARPVSVYQLRELTERLVSAAEAVEAELRMLELREHDGYRALARQLELVAEALDDVDRVHGEILPLVDDLRRRWNDPDA